MNPDREAVTVRLVYDGPPRSGKTTSVRALAAGMARQVFSPEEEDGRTLYFDWLEYVGGNFEGVPIHCQILSVPGQAGLASRRRALLAEADVVVFVLKGTAEHLPEAAAHLRDLRAFLAAQPSPRPGLVVQANQRDLAGTLPLPELRSALDLDGVELIESVATEGQGIREAFVLSVGVALGRVRELMRQGSLPAGPGESEVPEALLARLQLLDGKGPAPSGGGEAPRLPGGDLPDGWVWPAEGRSFLRAAGAREGSPRQTSEGSWRYHSTDWHFHSAPQHELERLDDAQGLLRRWAREHEEGFPRLLPERCLALAETGRGTWRLWQAVRAAESLRKRLRSVSSPASAADLLRRCAGLLLEARGSFREAPLLPCRLDLIAEAEGRPVYIGLLPPVGWAPVEETTITGPELLRRELEPLIDEARRERPATAAALEAELREILESA